MRELAGLARLAAERGQQRPAPAPAPLAARAERGERDRGGAVSTFEDSLRCLRFTSLLAREIAAIDR